MGEGHGEVPKEVQDEVVEEAKKDEGTPEKKMMVGSSGFVTEVKSLKEQMAAAEEDLENRDK
ncbi:MAG: hypothetical protein AAB549_01020 [Patescibacteria group bacterium]